MSDVTVEADAFGRTLEQLLGRLGDTTSDYVMPTVDKALAKGEKAWKRNATAVLSASYSRGGWGKLGPNAKYYKSGRHKGKVKSGWYGTTIKTGKYARSIKHHLMTEGREFTEGEIGSPTVPGLAHLLEKGHGYFTAAPHVHIEPASQEAFDDFEKLVDVTIEKAINDV